MAETYTDVVTGASSGIGECVARLLLAEGGPVVLVARRGELLAEKFGGCPNAVVVPLDLERGGAADELARRVGRPVRYFAHVAGFTAPAPVGMIEEATMHRLFQLHAVFPLSFLGWMAKRVNHADGAAAVVVTSRSVFEADRGNAAYCASKGAVEGMAKTVESELASRGVRFATVSPGPVDTPMARNSWLANLGAAQRAEAEKRLVPPETVAREIVSKLKGEIP